MDFVEEDGTKLGAFRKEELVRILKNYDWEISYGTALIPKNEYNFLNFEFDEDILYDEKYSFNMIMVYFPEKVFVEIEGLKYK